MIYQDPKIIKLVTSRQGALESKKTNYNSRMQDVADFVSPHREDILGTRSTGESKGTKIFDGTAVGAAVLAADGIHGYHVSPAFDWFRYVMSRKAVNKISAVREWLQEVEHNMYMVLSRSNFYSEMWSYIYDGFTIGTAAIYPEEDLVEGRIVFETIHPGEIYIEENKYGEVDVFHRKRKMSARKLIQYFGKEDCPEIVRNAAELDPFQEFEIIHAVFPREEYDSRMKDAKNKRFASIWYLTTGNHLLRVSGHDSFRYKVWRYLKNGKEAYGLSPATLAMSDIKGINLMAKTLLGAAQLAVSPAYTIPVYLQGKTNLQPRGHNYMENANDKINVINDGSGYPVGSNMREVQQQSIRERFHVDTFLMMKSLAGSGQRTAYEVSEMVAEKAAVLGAELGPLNTQIDGILDCVYEIETSAKRMPAVPDILQEMAADDPTLRFDPEYQGPLAQAQREKFGKDSIRSFFMDMKPVVEMQLSATGAAEVLDGVDFDATREEIADLSGLPEVMRNKPEKVVAIRKGRAEAIQQQNEMDQAQEMAEGVKTATEADKNTGGKLSAALEQVMGGGGA